MNILTIETTCDETAAAVVTDQLAVLGSAVASQDELHRPFGGVVPEIASRAHVERILPVIDAALAKAGLKARQLDAVAVANTPGLAGSLLVGLAAAKALAVALADSADRRRSFAGPCLCLPIGRRAGGVSLHRIDRQRRPHELVSLPSAAGFHVARAARSTTPPARRSTKWRRCMGLPYPGGPAIEAAARGGNPRAFSFPRPFLADRGRLEFSFSGLKTAVRYQIQPPGEPPRAEPLPPRQLADLAASFQAAVIDCLAAKSLAAIEESGLRRLCVGGGVAANGRCAGGWRRTAQAAASNCTFRRRRYAPTTR